MKYQDTMKIVRDFVVASVVLSGVLYSATNSWKNGEKLAGLESDMKGVRESLIALLLDERPNRTELATKLLSNVSVMEGLEAFTNQNYVSAFSVWSDAALEGDEDSTFAIYAAKVKLSDQIAVLPEGEQREKLIEVVNWAPEVEKQGENYVLSSQMGKYIKERKVIE